MKIERRSDCPYREKCEDADLEMASWDAKPPCREGKVEDCLDHDLFLEKEVGRPAYMAAIKAKVDEQAKVDAARKIQTERSRLKGHKKPWRFMDTSKYNRPALEVWPPPTIGEILRQRALTPEEQNQVFPFGKDGVSYEDARAILARRGE